MPTEEEIARLENEIRDAFPVAEPPYPIIRDHVARDEFYIDIVTTLASKRWDEIDIAEWRYIGLSMKFIVDYMTEDTRIYFLPSLMISGIEVNVLEYAIDALLPTNQRWEPGGTRWDAFVGALNAKQCAAIRRFLEYTIKVEPEGSSSRAGAEHALWYKFYG